MFVMFHKIAVLFQYHLDTQVIEPVLKNQPWRVLDNIFLESTNMVYVTGTNQSP